MEERGSDTETGLVEITAHLARYLYVEIESATFDVNPNPIQDSTFVFLFDLDLLDNATGEVIRTISG